MHSFITFFCLIFLYYSPTCFSKDSSLLNKVVQESLVSNEISPSFKYNLKTTYEKGPNFNKNDYAIVFSCGGPATCISILYSKESKFIYFPFPIIGYVNFNKNSNKICINGENAMSDEKYKDHCYRFISGELIER